MAPNIIHWFGAFMLFASMALLVVVSVSAPIWDTVGYLKGNVNGVSTTWGNWGLCTANGCSSATLGYSRNFIRTATGSQVAGDRIMQVLSKTLILAPIAAGLTFIALLFALSTHLVMGILASIASLIALLATLVFLGLALGFFITARNRINDNVPNSNLGLSSMIWLVVAAAGAQLIAALTVCFTRSRRSRKARDQEFSTVPAMRSTHQQEPVVTDYYASSGAPTDVGSTGPLVQDNTYSTSNQYAAPVGAYNETSAVEPMGTTTSGANGHWWKRA
ncbi:uncharacterized protein RHOBADRAFT_46072 [Rhodotorula graminis WP1]|uniref:Pali-domain-containing protein n=1 Tax=Rhodotorula graminis (strain WP1) TaxID=578459 RepID=A0A0P9EV23_RHOGW|nr:uncharacterized protein RHOBADRAFT_46072 [Rhodotorula graminis WP1]KPV72978.1 hypothetical protein RHOBADRAFT_46072 [Rhodotorula graminis WP1]